MSEIGFDSKSIKYTIYIALESFEEFKKKDPYYRNNKELQEDIKTLFGLIKYDKFDINNLPLNLINTLYIVLNHHHNILDSDIFMNETVMDIVVDKIEEAIKPKEESSFNLTEEELIKRYLVHNKKVLMAANINSFERRTIYQAIDSYFDANDIPSKYMKEIELTINSFKIKIKAKLGQKQEHIYKILSLSKLGS